MNLRSILNKKNIIFGGILVIAGSVAITGTTLYSLKLSRDLQMEVERQRESQEILETYNDFQMQGLNLSPLQEAIRHTAQTELGYNSFAEQEAEEMRVRASDYFADQKAWREELERRNRIRSEQADRMEALYSRD